MKRYQRSDLIGIGLRPHHYEEWIRRPPIEKAYLEAISDSYLYHIGGPSLYFLHQIRERYPILLHGVGLNLGSVDPIDRDYLSRIKNLRESFNASIVSDHLSFSSIKGKNTHSLLPLPRSLKTISLIKPKIHAVQETLNYQLTIENISRYMSFHHDEMSEIEFLSEMTAGTGAAILLDVNNLYVTCKNEGTDPWDEIEKIGSLSVNQYHIAGHRQEKNYLYDTHSGSVHPTVWRLLERAMELAGTAPIILERDDHEPLSVTVENWCEDPKYRQQKTSEFGQDADISGGSKPVSSGYAL